MMSWSSQTSMYKLRGKKTHAVKHKFEAKKKKKEQQIKITHKNKNKICQAT